MSEDRNELELSSASWRALEVLSSRLSRNPHSHDPRSTSEPRAEAAIGRSDPPER